MTFCPRKMSELQNREKWISLVDSELISLFVSVVQQAGFHIDMKCIRQKHLDLCPDPGGKHICAPWMGVCAHTRGSLLLIVNEDWCLEVVTLYKVSWWNPCILISSVLCSVRHTAPFAPGFPWPRQWWPLWWLMLFSWSTALCYRGDWLLGKIFV